MSLVTQEELMQLLHYSPETGLFTRKVKVSNNPRIGQVGQIAGSNARGYIVTTIKKKSYKAHRLAWLYVYGKWPDNDIDHINGIKSDNRICNLRDVNDSQNQQNKRKATAANKSSGLLGVTWRGRDSRWRAKIKINGKSIDLGLFKDPNQAHEAYLKAKRDLHPFGNI